VNAFALTLHLFTDDNLLLLAALLFRMFTAPIDGSCLHAKTGYTDLNIGKTTWSHRLFNFVNTMILLDVGCRTLSQVAEESQSWAMSSTISGNCTARTQGRQAT